MQPPVIGMALRGAIGGDFLGGTGLEDPHAALSDDQRPAVRFSTVSLANWSDGMENRNITQSQYCKPTHASPRGLRNRFVVSVLTASAMAVLGCASYRNLTVAEVRAERHFYKMFTFHKSLAEVRASLYRHAQTCRPLPDVQVDPQDSRKGQILLTIPGLTKTSVVAVMDFTEDDAGTTTELKTYLYYVTWGHLVQDFVNAIERPDSC